MFNKLKEKIMKKNLKNQETIVSSEETLVASLMMDGEETTNEETSSVPQYDNLDWLNKTTPFFPEEFTSLKCNVEREPAVQEGIKRIAEIDKDFPSLLLTLGNWWENKAARAEIKKMIDAEAQSKGQDPTIYMQVTLRQFAEKYMGLADAARRMCYAITYFKPRGGIKENTTKVNIGAGEIYLILPSYLKELKEKFGEDREGMKQCIRETCAKEVEIVEEL